jgi:hypothetical protein
VEVIVPPIDVRKDWLDYAFVVFSALLVLVGGFQVIWLRKTMRATKESADAAKASAEALMSSERPWLMLDPFDPLELVAMPVSGPVTANGTTIRYGNYGKTPAWLVESAVRFVKERTKNIPAPLDYGEITRPPSELAVLPGKGSNPIWCCLEPNGCLSENEIQSIERQELFLFLFGFIKYRDTFDRSHETRFCFRYDVPSGFSPYPLFVYAGPAGSNKCT